MSWYEPIGRYVRNIGLALGITATASGCTHIQNFLWGKPKPAPSARSARPSSQPTTMPASQPTSQPSSQPASQPASQPSLEQRIANTIVPPAGPSPTHDTAPFDEPGHPVVEGPPPVGPDPEEVTIEKGWEVTPEKRQCTNGKAEMVTKEMSVLDIFIAAQIYNNLPEYYTATDWQPVWTKVRGKRRLKYQKKNIRLNNLAIALGLACAESALDPFAVSGAGAAGFKQVIPVTARYCFNQLSKKHCEVRLEDMVIFNPLVKGRVLMRDSEGKIMRDRRGRRRYKTITYRILPTVDRSVPVERLRWYGKVFKAHVAKLRRPINNLTRAYYRQMNLDNKAYQRENRKIRKKTPLQVALDQESMFQEQMKEELKGFDEEKKRIADEGQLAMSGELAMLKRQFAARKKAARAKFNREKAMMVSTMTKQVLANFRREYLQKRAEADKEYRQKKAELEKEFRRKMHALDKRFDYFYNTAMSVDHFQELLARYTGRPIRYRAKTNGEYKTIVRNFQGVTALGAAAIAYNMGPYYMTYGLIRTRFTHMSHWYARACRLSKNFCGNQVYVHRFMSYRRKFTKALEEDKLSPEFVRDNFKYGAQLARNLWKVYEVTLPKDTWDKLQQKKQRKEEKQRLKQELEKMVAGRGK